MKKLVLYHASCVDGFTACWVAHSHLGDDAEYVPVQYGQDPPDVTDRKVYILDFSYKREALFKMAGDASFVVVLDHHKTAEADLAGFEDECISNNIGCPTIVFDMEKSGARLAWEHFYPGKPAPWIVGYVEDRDLWRWALPRSKEISAFLMTRPRTFAEWNTLAALGRIQSEWDDRVQQGEAVLCYQDQLVKSICKTAREVTLDGHKILAANTSCLFSEVAEALCADRPFGAAWFIRSDGKKQWSLRSRNGFDVSAVARNHGGGGHAAAAGFEEDALPSNIEMCEKE